MKQSIIKWCLQFFLSYLLSFLTREYGPHLFGYGQEAGMFVIMFFIPLVNTAGVVLGDISLYRGEELINQAVVMAIVLAVVGIFAGSLAVPILSLIPRCLEAPLTFGPMIIPPLIGYNIITNRKRRSAREEEKQ